MAGERLSASVLQAVLSFVQVLQGLPSGVIATDRIGMRRPASASELPMIAVSLAAVRESPVGIGRHVALARVGPEAWATTSGSRCTGELHAELWAAGAAEISTLTSAVLDRLDAQASAARTGGFVDLSLRGLGPAQPAAAGAGAALMMPLVFDITFEHLQTPPPGGEGIIRTVHVDLTGEHAESLDVT
jgi:hypothetical protein